MKLEEDIKKTIMDFALKFYETNLKTIEPIKIIVADELPYIDSKIDKNAIYYIKKENQKYYSKYWFNKQFEFIGLLLIEIQEDEILKYKDNLYIYMPSTKMFLEGTYDELFSIKEQKENNPKQQNFLSKILHRKRETVNG